MLKVLNAVAWPLTNSAISFSLISLKESAPFRRSTETYFRSKSTPPTSLSQSTKALTRELRRLCRILTLSTSTFTGPTTVTRTVTVACTRHSPSHLSRQNLSRHTRSKTLSGRVKSPRTRTSSFSSAKAHRLQIRGRSSSCRRSRARDSIITSAKIRLIDSPTRRVC